jgi:lipopolysaccharide transport system permease protein/teichoic acid transport system permease protein
MLKSLFYFLRLIYLQKYLIISLAKRDISNQYVGSFLGVLWNIVNPIITIFVFWVVFSLGFRVQPKNDVPFVVWLTAGIAIWFVFADIINGSSGLIVSNAHLIKKTPFHPQILPVVKIISSLITHAIFIIVLIALILIQKLPLSLYFFQFLYYLFCMVFLTIGISWIVSTLNVFIKDVGHIVSVLLQIGFWSTPIFWNIEMMPSNIRLILKLNPVFYLVQGYRESFIYFSPFWNHPYQTLYFWAVATIVFMTGALLFKKLKHQFADVL